jgi:hypothetical protein
MLTIISILQLFSIYNQIVGKDNFDVVLYNYYNINPTTPYTPQELSHLLNYYDSIISIRPNMAFSYLERGYILLINKNVDLAQKDFYKSIKYKEIDNDAYIYLAITHSLLGNQEEALLYFKNYENNVNSSELYHLYFCIYLLYTKDYDLGCKIYHEKIQKLNNSNKVPPELILCN